MTDREYMENKVRHAFNKGYDLGFKDGKEKAKSQQPCEDAISRQAVIDAFGLSEKTRKYGGDHSGYNTMMLYEIQDVIEELPTVSTEKTGRWKWVQYDFDPRIGNWHCSECRNIVFQGVEKKGIYEKSIYKYCPWCGAKMEQPYKGESEE